jgi:methionine sulfoxide reductase heme-binding subunit
MSESNRMDGLLKGAALGLAGLLALVAGAVGMMLVGDPLGRLLNALFALDSVQALWYVTRAAGLIAYLLLWLSTVWGLAVASKIFDPLLHRAFTFDAHEFLSLLAIGFTIIHLVALLGDRYLPFTLAQILVPFAAPYRPLWVGVGVIGLYLTLLVTITFYLRRWISQKAFRTIHLFSFLAYAGVTLHGLFAGTDSVLLTTQVMYAGTALTVVFLSVYWYMVTRSSKPSPKPVVIGHALR